MYTTLVDVETLAAHMDDPNWAVIDCRFELSNPQTGEAAYRAGHIPGALYAHLDRDLAAPISAGTGRHPLPDAAAFAATLGNWGVGPDTQVVAYDADVGVYAARLWWMLRWLGHEAVAVLDGGYRAWQAAGLRTATASSPRPPTTFVVKPSLTQTVDAEDVALLAPNPDWRILDARGPERFAGTVEPIDSVAGHVPGARNHPFATNVAADGRFLSSQELRKRFDASQSGVADERTVAMCGSGVTACHLLLAMEVAGKHGGRLYPGSWSEWIRDPARPTATGTE